MRVFFNSLFHTRLISYVILVHFFFVKVVEEKPTIITKPEPMEVDVQHEVKPEVEEVHSPPSKKLKPNEEEDVNMEGMTPDAIKQMILGGSSDGKDEGKVPKEEVTITTTTTVTASQTFVDGVVKSVQAHTTTTDTVTVSTSVPGTGRTIQTLNAKSTVYSAQQNRRFCAFRTAVIIISYF